MEELNEQVYEVEKLKKKMLLDLPIQIGVAVYSYAKLRMIEFWEFINKFLMNDHYQLMEMDTDSLYIAFAKKNIDDCIKPEYKEQWFKEKWNWFSSNDTTMMNFHGKEISFAQWDYRTPGKFKVKYVGTGMICLNSKVYHIWGGVDKEGKPKAKTSCKGTQQKRNPLLKEHFLQVLQTQKTKEVVNAGFINFRSWYNY